MGEAGSAVGEVGSAVGEAGSAVGEAGSAADPTWVELPLAGVAVALDTGAVDGGQPASNTLATSNARARLQWDMADVLYAFPRLEHGLQFPLAQDQR